MSAATTDDLTFPSTELRTGPSAGLRTGMPPGRDAPAPAPPPQPPVPPEVLDAIRQVLVEVVDAADLETATLEAVVQPQPPADPFWLSALRGRVLAAASAGFTAWLSAETLWRALVAAWSGGGWAGAVAAIEQAGVALDAGSAFALALAGLVGLAASINSKVREWLGRLGR